MTKYLQFLPILLLIIAFAYFAIPWAMEQDKVRQLQVDPCQKET